MIEDIVKYFAIGDVMRQRKDQGVSQCKESK